MHNNMSRMCHGYDLGKNRGINNKITSVLKLRRLPLLHTKTSSKRVFGWHFWLYDRKRNISLCTNIQKPNSNHVKKVDTLNRAWFDIELKSDQISLWGWGSKTKLRPNPIAWFSVVCFLSSQYLLVSPCVALDHKEQSRSTLPKEYFVGCGMIINMSRFITYYC